jgi:hypothetical protein
MNSELLSAVTGRGLGEAILLGIVILWLIMPTKSPLNYEHSLFQIGKFFLKLSLFFFSLRCFIRRKYRLVLLNCEYAFLQLLRCKFWLLHGYDVMDVQLRRVFEPMTSEGL